MKITVPFRTPTTHLIPHFPFSIFNSTYCTSLHENKTNLPNTQKPFCAAVGFSDITSANVVGYQQKNLGENANPVISSFEVIGDEELDINALVPKAADRDIADGEIQIQEVLSDMSTGYTFFYVPEDAIEGYEGMTAAGWFCMDEWAPAVKTFAPGEGFILVTSSDDANITFSGAVQKTATVIVLGENANLSGNITAVDIDINALLPIAEDRDIADGEIQIQEVLSDMSTGYTFFYVPEDAIDGYEGMTEAGWFCMDEWAPAVKTFAPGDGFVIVTSSADAKMKIPAAVVD